jgi:hypothetical protein
MSFTLFNEILKEIIFDPVWCDVCSVIDVAVVDLYFLFMNINPVDYICNN